MTGLLSLNNMLKLNRIWNQGGNFILKQTKDAEMIMMDIRQPA
jgi:hypothetical protein